jgi:hypothetical protein
MTHTDSTQSPYTFPFTGGAFEDWQALAERHLAHMETLRAELQTLEDAHYEKALAAIDEGAKLLTQSLHMGRMAYTGWREQAASLARAATAATAARS